MKSLNPALLALALLCSAGVPAQERKSMFVFQDNFWLNLHQFLPYVDVSRHDVLFDDLSRKIGNALAAVGDVQVLPESLDGVIGTNTRVAMNSAAPIYRTQVWPARRRDNETWIASAKALLAQHETTMAAALARIYAVDWPRDPILVDVVPEVGPNSAITHGGPPGFAAHTQASAGSLRNTGDAPLELLFHEASHAALVERHIQSMIREECTRQKLQAPENLWHAVIMFTSGAVARQELAKSGNAEYVPYAYRYNQYTPVERSALERDWQPYLEGKASREKALHDLVRDVR